MVYMVSDTRLYMVLRFKVFYSRVMVKDLAMRRWEALFAVELSPKERPHASGAPRAGAPAA